MPKIKEKEDNQDSPSKNLLNALLKGDKDGKHFNFIQPQFYNISTGSLLLDYHIKLRSGMSIRLGGPPATGKSSAAFLIAKNYMSTLPKSKVFYVNAEHKLTDELKQRTDLKFVETADEWNIGTVFNFKCNDYGLVADQLEKIFPVMHENDEHLCVIIDSIDMLSLEFDRAKDATEARKPAGLNYVTKELFRRIAGYINNYNGLLMAITQYSATFKIDPYSKDAPKLMEGNQTNALNHMVSYALSYQNRNHKDFILENQEEKIDKIKNKVMGVYCKVDIKKSATDNPYTIEIPIKNGQIGNAIWKEREIADYIMLIGLAQLKDKKVIFGEYILSCAKEDKIEIPEEIRSLNMLSKFIEENPEIAQWFLKKFETFQK